jgi:hypothetical protein
MDTLTLGDQWIFSRALGVEILRGFLYMSAGGTSGIFKNINNTLPDERDLMKI